MKTLKIILGLFLAIHVFTVLAINFSGYKIFSDPNYIDRLNGFGKKIVHNMPSNEIRSYSRVLATFMGTDRGYSFFSPNVSRSSLDIVFIGNDGKEISIPFNSTESRLKFTTADSLLESYLLRDEKIRDQILKSLSKWMFTYNKDLSSINVYLNLHHYNNLYAKNVKEYHVQEKRFFGFTIQRNKTTSHAL